MDNIIRMDFNETTPLKTLLELEWIETNGLGGWASSTVCGANTRRYHGILVASTEPPVGRYVMLSRLDETVTLNGTDYPLATRIYPGAVNPSGFRWLRSFEKGLFPSFVYEVQTESGSVILRKTVVAPNGQNSTIIRYELVSAPGEITLALDPFVAGRDYHSLTHANSGLDQVVIASNDSVSFRPYSDLPEIKIMAKGIAFTQNPAWYYQFEYAKEQERGLDAQEDLFHYGSLTKRMACGDVFDVVITTEEKKLPSAGVMISQEENRRRLLLENQPARDRTIDILTLAADQFIVQRGTQSKTIIAGYHWFTDWGRDTMIALPGLCIATGRAGDAKIILETFAEHVSEGMLPNRFTDSGESPEYNTVDATLWFFVAIYRYYSATGDAAFVRSIYKTLLDIIDWHEKGTRYGIRVDKDSLLTTGDRSVQLTWMDAKVGDTVITPRTGKAVEINALWCNALAIAATLAHLLKDTETALSMENKFSKTKKAFQKAFWNEEAECLYDVIDGELRDASIRPNQLIALSLPFEVLGVVRAKKVLKTVEEQLLTPFGLRSLSPNDPNYIGEYCGGPSQRDAAYHQGTVWSWLLGPYIEVLIRYRKDKGKQQAQQILDAWKQHLQEAGVGTVSEIFDGNTPYTPRGCIAQAWGVGELLRVFMLL